MNETYFPHWVVVSNEIMYQKYVVNHKEIRYMKMLLTNRKSIFRLIIKECQQSFPTIKWVIFKLLSSLSLKTFKQWHWMTLYHINTKSNSCCEYKGECMKSHIILRFYNSFMNNSLHLFFECLLGVRPNANQFSFPLNP